MRNTFKSTTSSKMNFIRPQQKRLVAILLILPLSFLVSAFFFFNNKNENLDPELVLKKTLESRLSIAKGLEGAMKSREFPEKAKFEYDGSMLNLKINYTLDNEMQSEAEKILTLYKPDYASIVMMDATTGEILAMTSFEKGKKYYNNWALKATFPAASVFKVITATAAVDKAGITPEHKIAFNGGNYTLYKKNVMTDKVNRWTRTITLKDAFARSINTAFGRLSLESLDPKDLEEYAKRFMFNQDIPTDMIVEKSHAYVPNEKNFELTQVASGYNRVNRMSPVHGAMIAGAIVNDGKMMVPHLVDSLEDSDNNVLYKAYPLERGQIIAPESAVEVRHMMEQTVLAGTSRKAFKKMIRDKKFKEVEMGGKTGHLTGDNPRGRTDWFVGYATDGERKISIAVVNVSAKRWTIKSSQAAEMLFRKYFKQVLEEKKLSQLNTTM